MPRGHMVQLFNILSTQADVNWRDVLERVGNKGPEVREFALQKAGRRWHRMQHAAQHCLKTVHSVWFLELSTLMHSIALPTEAPSEQQGAQDVPMQGQDTFQL
jgi:hypothetical protein